MTKLLCAAGLNGTSSGKAADSGGNAPQILPFFKAHLLSSLFRFLLMIGFVHTPAIAILLLKLGLGGL